MKTGRVVLASGGMDSFIAWFLYARSAINVFVDLGQPYAHKERAALENLAQSVPGFTVISVKGPDIAHHELPSGIIPMRNAVLVLIASTLGNDITLGVLRDEVNSDKSPEFMRAAEALMDISGRPQYWNDFKGTSYKVHSPIADMSKTDLITTYLAAGGDINHLAMTVSCYSEGGFKQCGACPSCFKRWVAMVNLGISEFYEKSPADYGRKHGYDSPDNMRKNKPYWSDERIDEITNAMRMAQRQSE